MPANCLSRALDCGNRCCCSAARSPPHRRSRSKTTRRDSRPRISNSVWPEKAAPVAGRSSPTRPLPGGKALAQLSTNTAANRFLVAIYNPTVFANGEITTRCKPVSGRVDQACGLIIRAADAQNYYIARSNALENNVRFYRVRNGERQQLATAENVPTPRGQWHTLTLRAEGNRYTVSLNGKALHTTTDTTTAEPRPTEGRAGLWVKSDSVTHFERIEITKLP